MMIALALDEPYSDSSSEKSESAILGLGDWRLAETSCGLLLSCVTYLMDIVVDVPISLHTCTMEKRQVLQSVVLFTILSSN